MNFLVPRDQTQLLFSSPTLQFRFTLARRPFVPVPFLPDQRYRSPERCVFRSHAPVVSLDSFHWVFRGSHVYRTIATQKHVTEPRIAACCHESPTLRADSNGSQGESDDAGFISPLCVPYAFGMCCKTSVFRAVPYAFSCSSSLCSSCFCNRCTAM